MNVGDDSTTFSTRFLRRRDGGETLLLRQTRLKVVEGPSRGVEYVITRPRVRVGSSSESELRLDDPSVSRHHLELRATEKGLALRDLGSTNGTFVGGIRIERALIVEPVTLRLGDSVIAVIPEEAIVEIPLSDRLQFGELLGRSTAMRELF
ncbi:MAG: FHA domain-containing protein, partial [Deltaproteobacteria bacterium]|nr:FHA domain-containing protein [Deltaproteobacteria bacterium]